MQFQSQDRSLMHILVSEKMKDATVIGVSFC